VYNGQSVRSKVVLVTTVTQAHSSNNRLISKTYTGYLFIYSFVFSDRIAAREWRGGSVDGVSWRYSIKTRTNLNARS